MRPRRQGRKRRPEIPPFAPHRCAELQHGTRRWSAAAGFERSSIIIVAISRTSKTPPASIWRSAVPASPRAVHCGTLSGPRPGPDDLLGQIHFTRSACLRALASTSTLHLHDDAHGIASGRGAGAIRRVRALRDPAGCRLDRPASRPRLPRTASLLAPFATGWSPPPAGEPDQLGKAPRISAEGSPEQACGRGSRPHLKREKGAAA